MTSNFLNIQVSPSGISKLWVIGNINIYRLLKLFPIVKVILPKFTISKFGKIFLAFGEDQIAQKANRGNLSKKISFSSNIFLFRSSDSSHIKREKCEKKFLELLVLNDGVTFYNNEIRVWKIFTREHRIIQ